MCTQDFCQAVAIRWGFRSANCSHRRYLQRLLSASSAFAQVWRTDSGQTKNLACTQLLRPKANVPIRCRIAPDHCTIIRTVTDGMTAANKLGLTAVM